VLVNIDFQCAYTKVDEFKTAYETDPRQIEHVNALAARPDILGKRDADLRPRPASAAHRSGQSEGAPATDYFGRRREVPFDAGAVAR